MKNIVALIWDFDKTIINTYMQDPIFKYYNIDANQFWHEVSLLPKKYKDEQGILINKDTMYLNHFLTYVKEGKMPGLNNQMLRNFGKELTYYKGIPEIFLKTKAIIEQLEGYKEYDLKVEHYIVSTGFKQVILGSDIKNYVDGIYGCDLIDGVDQDGNKYLEQIAYTIDNTTKTRAIFEINKGANKDQSIDVNATMSYEQRRIDFANMIYIADGPSDVPAFSVVKNNGGTTFAVYAKGNIQSFNQANMLRKNQRVDAIAEADYSPDTLAYMFLTNTILDLGKKMIQKEKQKLKDLNVPTHLN